MSEISNLLHSIGLSERETKAYLHLVKRGATKVRELSQILKIERVQLYRILKTLQKRGMVESTFEYPTSFIAVAPENVIDLIIESKKEEAHNLASIKEDLLDNLKLYQLAENDVDSDKFMVLEGGGIIYSRIAQMIQETKETLAVVTSGSGVIQAYRLGLLDYGFEHPQKDDVHFQFLTSLSTVADNLEVTKELLRRAEESSLCFESRIGDFGSGLFPRFIIKDGAEMLIFLKMTEDDVSSNQKDTGLWTNNLVLVHAFRAFFDSMWEKSKDIKDAIKEQEHKVR